MPGKLANVDFMVKDSKRFADSGGWGYAVFDYDAASDTFKPGTLAGTPPQGNDAKCGFACHTRSVSPTRALNLGRYVVRGVVQDEKGEPIWGIPIRIKDELIYSDSKGAFFVRLKKRGNYEVTVIPDQALNRARWELVTGPLWVQTGKKIPC